jgi:hypothetical protein
LQRCYFPSVLLQLFNLYFCPRHSFAPPHLRSEATTRFMSPVSRGISRHISPTDAACSIHLILVCLVRELGHTIGQRHVVGSRVEPPNRAFIHFVPFQLHLIVCISHSLLAFEMMVFFSACPLAPPHLRRSYTCEAKTLILPRAREAFLSKHSGDFKNSCADPVSLPPTGSAQD